MQARRRSNSKRAISFATREPSGYHRNKEHRGKRWSIWRRRRPRPQTNGSAVGAALLRARPAHRHLCAELPRPHDLQCPDRADQEGICAQRHHDGPARRLRLRAVLFAARHSRSRASPTAQPPQHRGARVRVLERDDVAVRHGLERNRRWRWRGSASASANPPARRPRSRSSPISSTRTSVRARSASTPSAPISASSSAISSAATSTSTMAGGWPSMSRGLPGIALAAILWLTISEPKRGAMAETLCAGSRSGRRCASSPRSRAS